MASVPESAVVETSADPELIGPDPREGGTVDSGGGMMHDCHDEIEAEEIAEKESNVGPAAFGEELEPVARYISTAFTYL